jgi:hypothetical protein
VARSGVSAERRCPWLLNLLVLVVVLVIAIGFCEASLSILNPLSSILFGSPSTALC